MVTATNTPTGTATAATTTTTGSVRLSIDWKVPLIVVLGTLLLACVGGGVYLAAIWLKPKARYHHPEPSALLPVPPPEQMKPSEWIEMARGTRRCPPLPALPTPLKPAKTHEEEEEVEVETESGDELEELLIDMNGEEVAEEDNQGKDNVGTDKGQEDKKKADQDMKKKDQKKMRKGKAWAATKAAGRSFRDAWNEV